MFTFLKTHRTILIILTSILLWLPLFVCVAELERSHPYDASNPNFDSTALAMGTSTSSSETSSTVDPCEDADPDVSDDSPTSVYPPEDVRFGNLDLSHLEWTSTDDATHYHIQLSTDANYSTSNLLIDERIDASDGQTYSIDTAYSKGTYHWRVRSEREMETDVYCSGAWTENTFEIVFTFDTSFGGGGTSAAEELNEPKGIAYNPVNQNLYITHKFNESTGFVRIFGTDGTHVGDIPDNSSNDMYTPTGIACDSNGNIFVVESDSIMPVVKKYDTSKNELDSFTLDTVSYHWDVEVDGSGSVYVSSSNELHVLTNDLATDTPLTLSNVTGIGIGDSPEVVYMGFWSVDFIQRRDAGTLTNNALPNQISSEGTGPWQFSKVTGVASDSDGMIYVADKANCRVHVFNADGSPYAYFGTEGVGDMQWQASSEHGPYDLTLDDSGAIYVIDTGTHRVQKILQ